MGNKPFLRRVTVVIKMSMTLAEILPVLVDHVRDTVPDTQTINIRHLEIFNDELLSIDFDVVLQREQPKL